MTIPLITSAKIGLTQVGAVPVNSLASGTLHGPLMSYQPYVLVDELSSGHRRGRGKPLVTWEFPYVTPAMADALATYCLNLTSSDVYIYTRTSRTLDVYAWFLCVMNWPQDEDIRGPRRESLKITFSDCISV